MSSLSLKKWRLFPVLSAPMPFQMTLDRLLFENHKAEIQPPLLRVYYSSAPWVSVGYAADKQPGYALAASQHSIQNIPVCRRITGGGTVVHGQDLIFSLFARKQDDPEKFESVETSYRHIHEAVKRAFLKLGTQADFYAGEKFENGRDCFLSPVATDLHAAGRKVAGGAQKRAEDVFLHEESIQPPAGLLLEDLERELLMSFAEYFGVKIERAEIRPDILFAAEKSAADCVLTLPDGKCQKLIY